MCQIIAVAGSQTKNNTWFLYLFPRFIPLSFTPNPFSIFSEPPARISLLGPFNASRWAFCALTYSST